MKVFQDLFFRPHPHRDYDTIAKLDFPNGYGVSVITGPDASCRDTTYEVAVFKDGYLTGDTYITDNILGFKTPNEITVIMRKIQNINRLLRC